MTSVSVSYYPILANMDAEAVEEVSKQLHNRYGIYYGRAWFSEEGEVPTTQYPMVMSFGLNPHYNNQRASVVRSQVLIQGHTSIYLGAPSDMGV